MERPQVLKKIAEDFIRKQKTWVLAFVSSLSNGHINGIPFSHCASVKQRMQKSSISAQDIESYKEFANNFNKKEMPIDYKIITFFEVLGDLMSQHNQIA